MLGVLYYPHANTGKTNMPNLIRTLFPMSHTAISTFDNCPNKFRAMYVDKEIAYTSSAAAEFGTVLHAVIEYYIYARKADKLAVLLQFSENEMDTIILDALKHCRVNGLSFVVDRSEVQAHFSRVKPIIDNFYSASDGNVEVESKLGIKIYDDGTVEACDYFDKQCTFRAKVDFIVYSNSTAVVIDWKTGKSLKLDGQLERSLIALLASDNVATAGIGMLFPTRVGTQPTSPSQVTVSLDDMHAVVKAKLVDPISDIMHAKDTNEWPAVRSGLCKEYCDVTSCRYCGKRK